MPQEGSRKVPAPFSFIVAEGAGILYADYISRYIIFMVLDGRAPDEGACVELGIAYASGKRCYGIKSDSRSVELDMDLNPMISGCFIKLFYNLDGGKLLNSLEEYLKKEQL